MKIKPGKKCTETRVKIVSVRMNSLVENMGEAVEKEASLYIGQGYILLRF